MKKEKIDFLEKKKRETILVMTESLMNVDNTTGDEQETSIFSDEKWRKSFYL